MKQSLLISRLKMLLTMVVTISVLMFIGVFVYLHNIGLGDGTKKKLITELQKKGINADFETLKFKIHKGLVAENLKFYQSPDSKTPLLSAKELTIDFDKTKFIKGDFEIDNLNISGGTISKPFSDKVENSPMITLENIQGSLNLINNNILESNKGISATWEGININIKGNIWQSKKPKQKSEPEIDNSQESTDRFRKLLTNIRTVIDNSEHSPEVSIYVEGDLSNQRHFYTQYEISTKSITVQDCTLRDVLIQGDYHQQLFKVKKIAFKDEKGSLEGKLNYETVSHTGYFDVQSSVNLTEYLSILLKREVASNFTFHEQQNLTIEGEFAPPSPDRKMLLKLIGSANVNGFSYYDSVFEYMEFDFSWQDSNLFIDELTALHQDGEITGRILMDKEKIRYRATSSLPAKIYLPFFKGRGLEDIVKQSEFTDDSRVRISAAGEISQSNKTKWTADGSVSASDLTYKNAIIKSAAANFNMNQDDLEYNDITFVVDHFNYDKYKSFGGDRYGTAKIEKAIITRDPASKALVIDVKNITGKLWPAPLIHLFHKKTSKIVHKQKLQSMPTINRADFNIKTVKPGWNTYGTVDIENFVFNEIPIKSLTNSMNFKQGLTQFSNNEVVFDHSTYPEEKQKLSTGKASVKNVDLIFSPDYLTIDIQNIKGDFWTNSALSLFAPVAAKTVDKLKVTTPAKSINTNLKIVRHRTNPKDWKTDLQMDLGPVVMNGITMNYINTNLHVSPNKLILTDSKTKFNLDNYSKQKKSPYKPSALGEVSIKSISKTQTSKDAEQISIKGITGSIWPAPPTAMFSKAAAKTIESIDLESAIPSVNSDVIINRTNDKWTTKVKLNSGRLLYNSVPISKFSGNLSFAPGYNTYNNLKGTFDYTNYALRKKTGGPKSASVNIPSVKHNTSTGIIQLSTVKGSFYPGPLVKLFSHPVAKHLEDYRFRGLPYMSFTGNIDSKNNTKTNLTVSLSHKAQTNYTFLDGDIALTNLKAQLKVTSNSVHASSISANALGSSKPMTGSLTVSNLKGKQKSYKGIIAWHDAKLSELAKTYDFKSKATGTLEGYTRFSGRTGDTSSINGTGVINLIHGNLFSVPILGPLSPIMKVSIGALINDKKLGYERVKKAHATLHIKKGVVYVHDFSAQSSSFAMLGLGWIDMNHKQINLQVRVGKVGSGIFQILNAPLIIVKNTPILKGLFQYRGTGPISKPKWAADASSRMKLPPLPPELKPVKPVIVDE